jgi:hypothetical protein
MTAISIEPLLALIGFTNLIFTALLKFYNLVSFPASTIDKGLQQCGNDTRTMHKICPEWPLVSNSSKLSIL